MPLPVAPSHAVPGLFVSSESSRDASTAPSISTGVCSATSERPASTIARNRPAAASISEARYVGALLPRRRFHNPVSRATGPDREPSATGRRPGSCDQTT